METMLTARAGEAELLAACPEYASTRGLDELRATELARLDRLGHVYLDYTGGGLYGESLVRERPEISTVSLPAPGRAATISSPSRRSPTSRACSTHPLRACHLLSPEQRSHDL
ncbi:MAG TPA: hypothetical protein VH988_24590 [Thermoanaerobaculia bacterium]|jgi:hypothetical protein|nr:hypothetical protein [Thermoanaerobaculia bacterium]